jgi:hypothetical protein
MSELTRAIDWYLQRRPRIYAIEIEPGFFLWVTSQLSYGFPLLKVLYHIDDTAKTVTLLSIDIDTQVNPSLQ